MCVRSFPLFPLPFQPGIEMGDNTRRRLQIMARNFELRLNANKGAAVGASGIPENSSSAAERRGLLDEDDDVEQIEFEMHKKDA